MSEAGVGCFVVIAVVMVVVLTLSWMMCGREVVGERGGTASRRRRIWVAWRVFRLATLGRGASSSCDVEMILPCLGDGGFRLGRRVVAMVGCR
jgi:hypothetical protein